MIGKLDSATAIDYIEPRETTPSQTTVVAFLEDIRSQFDRSIKAQSAPMHIIIGTEAADLDSICAAVARAKCLGDKAKTQDQTFYPVVNIPRKEFDLRRDAQHLLSLLGIDAGTLLFIDDIPLNVLAAEGRLKLHLVDHNCLAIHQSHLSGQVVSIVDHHSDAQVYYPECLPENKTLTTVGSATTLIAKDLLDGQKTPLASCWVTWLLAPILLDTSNLQAKSKTTVQDLDVVSRLIDLGTEYLPDELYSRLDKARADINGFTPNMLLRKDLKRYRDGEVIYTISSLVDGVEYCWEKEPSLLKTLQQFRSDQSVPFATILEFSYRGRKERLSRFTVTCASPELLEWTISHFKSKKELSEIARLESYSNEDATATWVLPSWVTRKRLQPILGLQESCYSNRNQVDKNNS